MGLKQYIQQNEEKLMKQTAPYLILFVSIFIISPFETSAQCVQTNGPYGGFIGVLAASPNGVSGLNLFAGTGNGVFLSTNNGMSWTPVDSGLTSPTVNAFAVSPNGSGGTNIFAAETTGVFLSTNNGMSWTAVDNGLTNHFVLALAEGPNGAGGTNLFAGTWGDGVFLSTNNGSSWNVIDSGLTNYWVTTLTVSGATLFAGTDYGVFRSTNNGKSWAAADSGMILDWVNAFAVSGTNIFAGTTNGGVFLSTNNGTNWMAVNNGLMNMDVTALGVSDTNLFAGTYGGGVFLSTNNGSNWTSVNTGLMNPQVHTLAVSNTNIFAGTYGNGVFLSTNNGTNWTAVNDGLTNTNLWSCEPSPTSDSLNSISFVDATTGFVTGIHGTLLFTPNGGQTWQNMILNPSQSATFNSTSFVNRDTGYVVGNGGVLMKLKRYGGGDTVQISDISNPAGTQNLNHIISPRPPDVLASQIGKLILTVGDSGSYVYSINYGSSFRSFATGTVNNLRSIKFFGPSTVWIVGDKGTILTGYVGLPLNLKSPPPVQAFGNYYDIAFFTDFGNSNLGIVIGDNGSIARTTNAGVVWKPIQSGVTSTLRSIYITNDSTGWIAGDSGIILKTTDGGLTWAPQTSGVNSNLNAIQFVDVNNGWVVGNNGTILNTDQGGVTSVVENRLRMLPSGFALFQNYPNPFNPATHISYTLTKASFVTLKIYDILGREVTTLVNGKNEPGEHSVSWNAMNVSSGVYFYRIIAGDFVQTKKMVLMK